MRATLTCTVLAAALSVAASLFAIVPTATSDGLTQKDVISLNGPDEWCFIDTLKPNDVVTRMAHRITIDGQPMQVGVNCRVAIYRHGAVVIPHGRDFAPLTVCTQPDMEGESQQCRPVFFYSNAAPEAAPDSLVQPLRLDNSIQSLCLKRGYMATLATEADGMGYSRVFVADTADLTLPLLPIELRDRVSFIRVMPWQYPSKKGWAGSKWDAMPEGLKYAPEQCDFTNSTWYYNWGTTATVNPKTNFRTLNQEFVPEKWGAGGDLKKVYALSDVTHLMGYNEPDHSEQSNVSVEVAIAEWPILQRTGLRLGSPATTDFQWLYRFMSQAKQKNYRVDYVVIHAYWGGLSGAEWYAKLKDVYEHTGRPLWIKEWNNGANWTKESWPSGTAEQQAKQLRDLRDILTVMDTASFVERYSIYNWVEDKRAIISKQATLTPAGEYYRDNRPDYFFRHDHEVVPVWTVRTAPDVSYEGMSPDGTLLTLQWTDPNGEMVERYTVSCSPPQSPEGEEVTTVFPEAGSKSTTCTISIQDLLNLQSPPLGEAGRGLLLRVCSHPLGGGNVVRSQPVAISHIDNRAQEPSTVRLTVSERWQPAIFRQPYAEAPLPIVGAMSYRNKMPLSWRLRGVGTHNMDYSITPWTYQESPSLANPDTLDVLLLPQSDRMQWGNLHAESGSVTVEGRTHVCFTAPFATQPVVVPTIVSHSASSQPATVRVVNADSRGFDLVLQYEGRTVCQQPEQVTWLAVEPGVGECGGRKVQAGLTATDAVCDNLTGGHTISFGTPFDSTPLLWAAMQTMNDTITATLRIKQVSPSAVTLFKDREKAVAHERVAAEQVGWVAMACAKDEVLSVKCEPHTSTFTPHTSALYTIGGVQVPSCHPLPRGLYVVTGADGRRIKTLIQ